MRLQFGACTFDRDRRELTRDGSAVHAGPQLLRLLELLIDARPRALTKDEVHAALWPATFVSDGTLTSLIAELRDAIGDEARAPRLVRTIHGYGYRFVGDVIAETPPAAAPQALPPCRIVVGDRIIGLPPGEHILGRAADAAVVVDDAGVSRHHARIVVASGAEAPAGAAGVTATLEDLGSKNGTILNGRTIEGRRALADGASIVLGSISLRFRVCAPEDSTATVTTHRPIPD